MEFVSYKVNCKLTIKWLRGLSITWNEIDILIISVPNKKIMENS